MTYLEANSPARRQFRTPRRRTPTGCIVVHTAESPPDVVGPDAGAENVARFIRNRTDPGSYHVLADSDSWVHVVPFSAEAYGDGTGSNPWAIHVSVASSAAQWPNLPRAWHDGAVEQLAQGTAVAIRWLKSVHGVSVPARRITRLQSERGEPGFISHGERDPGRRSDPGVGFPWGQFLDRVDQLVRPNPNPTPVAPSFLEEIMSDPAAQEKFFRAFREQRFKSDGPMLKELLTDVGTRTDMTVRRLDTVIAQQSAVLAALREAQANGLDIAQIEAAAERGAATALATLAQDEVTS